MRSHYDPSRGRWLSLLAAAVFALVAGLGPVLHFVEDAAAVRTHADAHATSAGHQSPGPEAPVPHTDLDCIFCQVLTSPSELGPKAPALAEAGPDVLSPPEPKGPAERVHVRAAGARDPPVV